MAKQIPDRGVGYEKYRAADGCWRPPRPEGLARVLAKAGYGARPRTVEIVRAGRVQVDGCVTLDPGMAVETGSEVLLDGVILCEAPRRYLMLNKPAGLECRLRGGFGSDLIRMLPLDAVGLEVAGRMDTRNAGLVLVSNDLLWNRLVTESEQLERLFHVIVSGRVADPVLDVVRAGVNIPSQGTLHPERVEIISEGHDETVVAVTILGDHARKVRAAFESLRCEVSTMIHAGVGSIMVDELRPGRARELSRDECRCLLPPDQKGWR